MKNARETRAETWVREIQMETWVREIQVEAIFGDFIQNGRMLWNIRPFEYSCGISYQ